MRLVHLGRTPAARLPAIACTGPPSGTPAAPLRSVLGKGSRLPEARAARGIELLLEPFTVPLPAIPVAVDLRQVHAQPRDLPVLLLDARVPRIILTLGRVRTLGHTPPIGTGAPNLQSSNADLRRDPLNKDELTTALGPDFEKQLHRIWDRARSVDEVEAELRCLRESIEDRRQGLTRVQERTAGLIESRFDDSVQQVFRQIADELPATLAELDADLERVALGYLQAHGVPHTMTQHVSRKRLKIPASPRLPEPLSAGLTVAMGRAEGLQDGESLHVAHPLVLAALDEARASGQGTFSVRFRLTENAPEVLRDRSGARGRLALTRVSYRGFEREDRLVATAVFEDAEVLRPAKAALELVQMPCEDITPPAPVLSLTPDDLDEVVDEELFFDQAKAAQAENREFEKTIDQLDQYMEDRLLVLRRTREDTTVRLQQAEEKRAAALGADARAKAEGVRRRMETELEELEAQIERLIARDDDDFRKWKTHAHQRRYEPPHAARLFSLEFVIA